MARALSDYPELARYMDGSGPDPKDTGRTAASAPPRRGPRPGGAGGGCGAATPPAEEEFGMDVSQMKDAQAHAGRIADLLSAEVPPERAQALADEIGGLVGASLMAAGVEPHQVKQLGQLVTGQECGGIEAER